VFEKWFTEVSQSIDTMMQDNQEGGHDQNGGVVEEGSPPPPPPPRPPPSKVVLWYTQCFWIFKVSGLNYFFLCLYPYRWNCACTLTAHVLEIEQKKSRVTKMCARRKMCAPRGPRIPDPYPEQGMISTLISWFDYQNQAFQACFQALNRIKI
jgi:hypothetical protein